MQGKMVSNDARLGDFTSMGNQIKAENCRDISHMEVPLELLQAPGTKQKQGSEASSRIGGDGHRDAGRGGQVRKYQHILHPYITYLEEFLRKPSKDAGNNYLGD